jgi:ELWxxDGT repeat protein
VLPNIVLFQGQDASNDSDLWEADGTGSGTFELAPTGAAASGLFPNDITVMGDQVLFEGADSSDDLGLWTTDGTALGTRELTSIAGASSAGLAPSDAFLQHRRRGRRHLHQHSESVRVELRGHDCRR